MVERLEVSVSFFLGGASVFGGFSVGNELEAYWTNMQQSLVWWQEKAGSIHKREKKSYQFSSG